MKKKLIATLIAAFLLGTGIPAHAITSGSGVTTNGTTYSYNGSYITNIYDETGWNGFLINGNRLYFYTTTTFNGGGYKTVSNMSAPLGTMLDLKIPISLYRSTSTTNVTLKLYNQSDTLVDSSTVKFNNILGNSRLEIIELNMPCPQYGYRLEIYYNYVTDHITQNLYFSNISVMTDSASTTAGNILGALANYNPSGNDTQSKIQADIASLINSNYDISKFSENTTFTNYVGPTESSDGYISGTVTVTNTSTPSDTKTESFNLVIPKMGQSLSTIYNSLNSFCSSYGATNASAQSDFLNAIAITNSNYSVSVGNWSKTNATASVEGSISCNVYIQQGGSTIYTIPVTKVIPKLADTVAMAKAAISSALANYKASNATTNVNLLNLAKSVVNTNYITVTDGAFNKTNSTEFADGSLSYTLNLSDTYSGSDSYTANLVIDKVAATAATAQNQIQNVLNNFNASNSTTSTSLLSVLNNVVDTDKITLSLSNFNLVGATETQKGSISATLTIKDSYNATSTLPINLTIDTLVQSVDTLVDEYTNYINGMQAKNSTTASDILNSITVTNQNITASMESYNVTPATDKVVGQIVGSIRITDGSITKYVSINKEISKLLVTAASAGQEINSVLSTYNATNATDATELLTNLKKVVDTDYITLTLPSFSKTNSTENTMGAISGTVRIKDTYNATLDLPINLNIAILPQSANTIYNSMSNYCNTYGATNASLQSDFMNAMPITNSNYKVSVGNWSKTNATASAAGSLSCNVYIQQGGSTIYTIPVTKVIPKLADTVAMAKVAISSALSNYKASNTTTNTALLNLAKSVVNTNYITVTGGTFNKTNATEFADGSLSYTLSLSDTYSNNDTYTANLVIDKVAATAATAQNQIQNVLNNFNASNTTTSTSLLAVLNNVVDTDKITLSLSNFNLVGATETQKGSISATLTIKDSYSATSTVPINLTIDTLVQSVDTLVAEYTNYINGMQAKNSTTASDILNSITVTNQNITATMESYNVTPATDKVVGQIVGSLKITDGSITKYVPINKEIGKLLVTAASAGQEINSVLSTYNATNLTDATELLTNLKKVVDTDYITLTLPSFSKTNSTENTAGSISGTVRIKDTYNNSLDLPINLKIAILPQSANTIYNSMSNYCNSYGATNASLQSDFMNAISITNSNYSVSVGNWSKTNATASTEGYLSCYVYIKQGGSTIYTIPVTKVIPKLADTVVMAKAAISSALSNYKASNATTNTALLNLAKSVVNTNYITVTGGTFNKTNSTEFADGSLSYTLNLSDTYSNSDTYTANLVIDKIAATAATAQNQIQNVLNNFNASNLTTSTSLLSVLNNVVDTDKITLSLSNFNLVGATETKKGSISATLTIKDSYSATSTLPINLTIDTLVQSVDTLVDEYTNYVNGMQAQNSTAAADILNAITVTNQNITASMDSYIVTPATDKVVGKIVGSLKITDGSITKYVSINKEISKLLVTAASAKQEINSVLSTYNATNDTDSTSLLTDLKQVVDTDYITLTLPSFSKTNSTENTIGAISGTVRIKDTYNNSIDLPISLKIGILPQSANTLYNSMSNYCNSYGATNASIQSDFMNAVAITNSSYSVSVGNWSKTNSTASAEGSLSCNVYIKQGGSTIYTIPVTKVIPKLADTVVMAKAAISSALSNYKASNTTTNTALLNLAKSVVNTNYITVTGGTFNKTNSTEFADGSLSYTLNLSDTYSSSDTYTANLVIDKVAATAATAQNQIQNVLNNYYASNSTTSTSLLSVLNSVVDTDKITLTLSNFNLVEATETQKGSINATLTIKDSYGATSTIPINLVIGTLVQSVDTLIDEYTNYINGMQAKNSTTASEVLNAITVTNQNITTSMESYNVTPATDKVVGQIVGSLKITDGLITKYVSINKEISKLLVTAASAGQEINSVLSTYNATNVTDSTSLLTDLKKVVDTDYITLTLPIFSKTNSTEKTIGAISGTVRIKDTYNNTIDLPINLKIATLDQSLDTVFNLYTSYISSMNATNDTTAQNILASVNITNENIKANLDDLVVTPATDTTEGNITGNIVISQPGYANKTVNISRVISRVNQSVSTAKSNLLSALNTFSISNSTTQTNYENLIKNSIDTAKIEYSISNFKVTPATESTRGAITGLINLKDSYGNTSTVSILNIIDFLSQSIDTVASLYSNKLPSYVPLNTTTANDILGLVNISNADITSQMLSYVVNPATDTAKGKITGIILLTNNKTGGTKTVSVYLPIDYLPQEMATTVKLTQDYLGTVTPKNSLDFTAMLNHINNIITNPNIAATWDYGTSNSPEILATETNAGAISKKLVITDTSTGLSIKIPVSYTIEKLPYTVAGVQPLIQNLLSSYTATNYSDGDNILNYFLTAINGLASSNVSLSIENFSIVQASETEQGHIDGNVKITDGLNTATVPFNSKSISLLPQTIAGIEELISNSSGTINIDNNTTNTTLLNSLNKLITGAGGSKISLVIDSSNFSLVPSTIDSTGLINAKVEVIDNSTNRDLLPISIVIPKLPQTVNDALNKINLLLSTYTATNETTENSLESLFHTVITGTSGNVITIGINSFSKTDSTESTDGSISGTISVIDNNGHSTEESLSLIIKRTEVQEIGDVLTRVNNVLSALKAEPSTITSVNYVDSLFSTIRSIYPLATIDTSGLKVTSPTPNNTGILEGQIIVSLGASTSQINTQIVIPQSDQNKADKVVSDLNELLSSITPGTITSLEELNNYLDLIRSKYPYATIDTNNIIITQSSAESDGSITGYIVVTVGGVSINVPVSILVPQTNQNILDKYLKELNAYLNGIDPSSITSLDNFVTLLNTYINSHPGVTLDTSKVTYTTPTADSNGNISGGILLTLNGLTKNQDVSMILPKDIQAKVDAIASEINKYILNGNIKSEADYIAYLDSIKIKYPEVTFNTSGITLIDSTTSQGGSAKGTLEISTGGYSSTTTINLSFTKLAAISGGGGGGLVADQTSTPIISTITATVDTSNPVEIESTQMSKILGISSTNNLKVVKYEWTAYKDSNIVNRGNLQVAYDINGNVMGVVVDANTPLDQDTKIDISFLKASNLSSVYIYNEDIKSYVLAGNTVTDANGNIVFNGNNKSTYVVTNDTVSSANNNFITNGWVKSDNNWYLVNNAECQTGWVLQNGSWYYLNPTSKILETGWVKVNSSWYYLNSSENNTGAMKTGWVKDNNNWYYMDSSGSLSKDWVYNNNNWYHLNSSGEMETGWQQVDGKWYYLNQDGSMASDTYVNGYYLNSHGALE